MVRVAEHPEDAIGGEKAKDGVEGADEEDRFLVGFAIERGGGCGGGGGVAVDGPALNDGLGPRAAAVGEDDVDDEGVHDGGMPVSLEGGREVSQDEIEPAVTAAGRRAGAEEVGDPGGEDGVEGFEEELGDDLVSAARIRHD